jgi:hypothetical protein
MSEVILLDKIRSAPVAHNPYYQYFKESIGRGDGIGDVIHSVPSFQRGYGIVNPIHFYQDRDQLGAGIGSFLMNLFRFTKPILRKGLHQVVDVASKVANDTIEGKNVKESLRRRAKEKTEELIGKIPRAFSGVINKSPGNGVQVSTGSGAGHKRRKNYQTSPRLVKKRHITDSAGNKKIVKSKCKYPLLKLL